MKILIHNREMLKNLGEASWETPQAVNTDDESLFGNTRHIRIHSVAADRPQVSESTKSKIDFQIESLERSLLNKWLKN